MDPILLALLAGCVLALVHNLAPVQVKTKAFGTDWNMGPRDTDPGAVPPLAGRLERARVNFQENFVVFAALALALLATGHADKLGIAAAWLWIATRAIYLPLYASGTPKIRTLVWAVGILALVLMGADTLR